MVTEFTCDVCEKVETDPVKLKSWRNMSCAPVPIPFDPITPDGVSVAGALSAAPPEPTVSAVVCGKGCRMKWNASLDAPAKAPAG